MINTELSVFTSFNLLHHVIKNTNIKANDGLKNNFLVRISSWHFRRDCRRYSFLYLV